MRRTPLWPSINRRLLIAIWLGGAAFAAPFAVSAVQHRGSVMPVSDAPALALLEASANPSPTDSVTPSEEPTTAPPTEEPTIAPPTIAPPTIAPPTDEPTIAPQSTRVIVTFTMDGWANRDSIVGAVGGSIESETPALKLAGVALPDAAVEALRAEPGISAVERDRMRQAEGEPSDARFAEQWALPKIGWTAVFGSVTPTANVTVAVLDTGVDTTHEDLAGRLVPGASFVDGEEADHDPNGHGTWMAGIVAAATDNGVGIAGTAWGNVKVMPITVLDADGNGLDSSVIAGIVKATDSGAGVILLALSSTGYSPALQAAIDYAWSHDVVVVAAAGNDGSSAPAYPAADRGVVGVAATNQNDQLTAASNRGDSVFLAAPGADILTTDRAGGYVRIDGTSASAAIVAGAAAVIRSVHPDASNAVVVGRLARDAAALAGGERAGNGRLDLARSLADKGQDGIEPAGAAPNGDGGPFIGPYTAASVVTWTGGGADANWTNGLNWGGSAPTPGDDLVFPAGAAQLTANNNFAAATTFNSITISGSGYTLTGNSIALGAGGLSATDIGATDAVNLPLSFTADRTVTVTDSGTTLTLGGIVSGAGGIVKTGSGVLALSGGNTYTGTTTVSAGTVDIHSNAALGSTTSTVVAAGAAVTVSGSGLSSAEPFTLNGSGISGAGALRNVANNNTLSGAITLASAATITSTSGTFTLSGAVTTAGFTLTYDGSGDVTKSAGAISGAGGLTKEGSGTLTIGAAQTYTGATTVNHGIVKLAIANGIGSSSAVTVASGATFDLAGFSDSIGSLAGGGTVTSSAAPSITLTTGTNATTTSFTGTLSDGSGTLGVTKAGAGTMTLAGTSAFSGVLRINTGVVAVSSDALLGNAPGSPTAGQLTFGGGTLETTTTFTLNANRGIAMTGAGTILTDPTTTLTYDGVIAGASTLTKSGSGTLVLSGTNTYTGATTVGVGVLRVQSNAALGATSTGSSVATGAAIEIDGSGLSVAEPVTSLVGTGISATGALRNLANDNSWLGTIVLASGGARINSDSGTLTLGGGVTGAGKALTVGGAGSVTENGVVGTTTGALTKDGVGTLTLANANTYTGATTINAGTVMVGVANAVGASSAVTVAASGTFDLGGFSDTLGSLAGAGSVTSSQAGALTLTVGPNSAATYSGVLSDGWGTISLVKNGTGVFTVSGANTFSGSTTINAGTIAIGADAALGTAPTSPTPGQLTFNGGTLLAGASLILNANRGVALNGAGTFAVNSGITVSYGGVIAGSGTLAKTVTGILILTGANTYSGATTITAGTLSINSDSSLGTPPAFPTAGALTFGGGTLLVTADTTIDPDRGIALTGAGTISVNPSVSVSYAGVVAGASTLTKSGTGTLALAGTNTYSGTTTVSAGTMRVQSNDALGATSAGTSVTSGAAIEIDGSGLSVAEPITSLSGTGISLAGALRNLSNDNTWSGTIAMAASSRINSDGGTLSLNAGVTGTTSALTLGGAGNIIVLGPIATTTGGLIKDGAGTATLDAANTYAGTTTVTVGTLRLGLSNPISVSSAVTVAVGGTLDLFGSDQTFGSLAGAGSVTSSQAGALTLTVGGLNSATTYSGALSDGASTISLVKNGTNTFTVSGTNSFTGSTTINAGTISIASDAGLGTAPASATPGQLTFNGGTLLASATLTLNGNRGIALSGPGTFSVNSSRMLSYGGVIDGVGPLSKTGAGTLTLSGTNTYTGTTTISAGTLSINSDSSLGTPPASPTPGALTFAGGTLLATASLTIDPDRGIALTGAGTISVNAALSVGYGGVIAGAANLTKAGAGMLTLLGTNTYTGTTTLAAGTLAISADSNLGTPPASPVANQLTFSGTATLEATTSFSLDAERGLTLSGAATFLVDPGQTLSAPGTIAGTSSLAKTGLGTLVLSGSNTFGGAATVSTGVLRMQSNSALGTNVGTTTIASGAAIEIDGSGLAIAEPVASMIGTGISNGGALRNLANDNAWSGTLVLGSGGARINSDAGTLTLAAGITGAGRNLTVGGSGNVTSQGVIGTTTGTLTKDGSGTLILSGANTYSGATTISAGTISISDDSNLGTPPASPSAGKLAISGGMLSASDDVTLNANRGIAVSGAGATFDVADGATLAYAGTQTGSMPATKTGNGSLDWSGATVTTGALTIAAGTITAPAGTLSVGGDFNNNSSNVAFLANGGTVSLTNSTGQALGGAYPLVFNNLTLTSGTDAALTNDVTVNAVLTLNGNNLTTGGHLLYVSSTGSVTRTRGEVVGTLTKYVAAGSPSVIFEIGDATSYTPATLVFDSVSVGGDVSASTTPGDHPQIATSNIDGSQSLNRYWTLSGSTIVFTSYTATFSFVASDVDAGSSRTDFIVSRYAGGAWATQVTTLATSTATTAAGIAGFGDFAIGVPLATSVDHLVVVAPPSATAGASVDLTITAVDSVGNRVGSYLGTVGFSSSDAYASYQRTTYTFTAGASGTKTLTSQVTFKTAGTQSVTVSDGTASGTSDPVTVAAGPFAGMQILLPGETTVPGSPSGRSGTPTDQPANVAFNVSVYAVDAFWNPVTAADTAAIISSDPLAVLPANGALAYGSATFAVTLESSGPQTLTASDVSDVTKTSDTSSSVNCIDTAPSAADDSYEMTADQTLDVPAAGVLANDTDADGQPVAVGLPSPVSGPSHGTVTLNVDGSFEYTPTAGYTGTDSFQYVANDGSLNSLPASVTIVVRDHSLISDAGWPTTFSPTSYLDLAFPGYVASGATVSGATFHFAYRSLDGAGTTCMYIEVYSAGALIGAHGSAGAPASCNSTGDYVEAAIALPEVNTVAAANDVTVRVFMANSAGARSQINLGTLAVDWYLP